MKSEVKLKTPKKAAKKAPVKKTRPRRASKQALEDPKAGVLQELEQAIASGHWMVAVWRVSDGQIFLDRTTSNFPTNECAAALHMLKKDLDAIK